jgi:uncharacterized membrane protein HdeD (DUF308 family)
VFGVLALLIPKELLDTFYGFFWALIILGTVLFLFLAITGSSKESMLWFGLSVVLLVIGLVSLLVRELVEYLFIVCIAALAIYNGFTDITLALKHPRTKYILIPGMVIASVLLVTGLFYLFPWFVSYLFLRVIGTFALVFGIFSILLGFYHTEVPVAVA